MTTVQIGQEIESIASQFLERQGLILVERNYRSKLGEIDLIMRETNTLVFVEVRYRSNTRFGTPAETVTHRKQKRLILCAQRFLQSHRVTIATRFDVIAVTGTNHQPQIEWSTEP